MPFAHRDCVVAVAPRNDKKADILIMKIPRPPPLLLTLILAVSMLGLDWAFPYFRAIYPPFVNFGFVPIGLGVLLILIAAGLFKWRKTTINPFGEPAVVVREGVYRFSRNPMYLGMLLVLIGTGIWVGNILALLLAPVFVWIMTRWYILREEQLMESRFGEQYRAYRRQVRRWI